MCGERTRRIFHGTIIFYSRTLAESQTSCYFYNSTVFSGCTYKMSFSRFLKSCIFGSPLIKPSFGCKYSKHGAVFYAFQTRKWCMFSFFELLFLFIYKLRLFKLNQLLKNIELPDRLKRAARSLQEIRQFSMTDQAALNTRICKILWLRGMFCRFEVPKNGVFAEAIFELFCCFRSEKCKYFILFIRFRYFYAYITGIKQVYICKILLISDKNMKI